MRFGTTLGAGFVGLCLFAISCGSSSQPEQTIEQVSARPLPSLVDLMGTENDFADIARQGQLAIQSCMRAQGFDYVPLTPISALQLDRITLAATVPEDRETAERAGFGLGPQLRASINAPSFDEFVDPNAAILDQLSDGARQAWEHAYTGDADRSVEPSSAVPTEGCVAQGFERSAQQVAFFDTFGDRLAEVRARVATDPAVEQALAGWTTCMYGAGYQVNSPIALADDFRARFEDLRLRLLAATEPSDALNAALDDLGAEEVVAAVVHIDCGGPYLDAYQQVRADADQDFIDRYESEIAELLEG